MEDRKNIINRPLIVFLVILSFVTGIAGGAGGIALVFNSPALLKAFNISETGSGITVNSTGKTETVTLKEDSATISAVQKVSPAVVSVVYTKDVNLQDYYNFGFPVGNNGQSGVTQEQGGGTGFVITAEGLIATNKHVADVDGAKYTVITQDGKKYDANLVATDPSNDFAILKIDAKNLPVVEYGDSDSLDIGQRVIAIGNALGEFQNSVTAGVLSGKERSLTATDSSGASSEELDGLLQTDAAINSGNSGGPLINTKGQVIGINTATASKSVAEGVGFAIPINPIKSAIESVKKTGKIVRPFLGVSSVMVDQKVAAVKGLSKDYGALVIGDQANGISAVQKDSPADKAGLKENDVILKVNNDEVSQGMSLRSLLSKYEPGNEVTLRVLRDGKEIDVKVTLSETKS
jgi:serine protease Do